MVLPESFQSATLLLERVGPWLLGTAAVASLGLFLTSLFNLVRRRRKAPEWARRPLPERLFFTLALGSLTACFGLLVWYHYRIWADLPLTLPVEVGNWINNNLRALARQGQGGLPPVDWSQPPRYAIPLWIEGEKFFFWALVYALALLYPFFRRTDPAFRTALYGFLNLYVWGVFFFARPFTEPLAKFMTEITPWFSAGGFLKAQLFFRLYPRMLFYYNSPYMWIHPPLMFAAYALLTITFASCMFMFFSARREHEREAYAFAKIGYVLLTFGMLIGYPWALQAWGPNWWWDPKIAASIMMWLLYSAYLHTRLYTHRRALWFLSAGLGMLCYLSLVFTYFMAWFFPGEHTF
jgi:ABC-type transport system involved in cytochrome c biogenesis permease subunit